jgi:hypothetical protein
MSGEPALVIAASAIPIVLGALTFQWQQRVTRKYDEARERRSRRIDYLTHAYEAVAAIGPAGGVGFLTLDEKRDVERAFRDAYVYGDELVVGALGSIVAWAESDRQEEMEWNPLLSALRDELRALYELSGLSLQDTPWMRTSWRDEERYRHGNGSQIHLTDLAAAATMLGVDEATVLDCLRAGLLPAPVVDGDTWSWPTATIKHLRASGGVED